MCKSLALEHYTHMTYVCIVTQQNKFIVENFISLLFRFISSSLFFRLCGCWFVCWLIVVCFFFFFFLLLFCSFHWVRSAQFTSIRSICTILSFTSHTREEKKTHCMCCVVLGRAITLQYNGVGGVCTRSVFCNINLYWFASRIMLKPHDILIFCFVFFISRKHLNNNAFLCL